MSIALNIPASNGTGAASDVSGLDPEKTFVIGGTLAPGEQIVIEGTADPAGVAGFAGLAVFGGIQGNFVQIQTVANTTPSSSQNLAPNAVEAVVNWMRVRRVSPTTSTATPTVSVDSTTTASQVFQAIAVPASQGIGATTNIAAQGTALQATVSGPFGPNEQVLLEGSIDGGISFDTIFAFSGPGTQSRDNCRYSLVRVKRQGVGNSSQIIQLFLGTSSAGAGGGGFPGFGGAPPAIASASAGGAAATASRSDHTHALDIVAYNPSIAGMQATGVIQQTYAAPTATPAVLNVATQRVPFGAAGLLATSPSLLFDNSAIARLTLGDGVTGGGRLTLNQTVTAGVSGSSSILHQAAGTTFATLSAARDGTAVTGRVLSQLTLTSVAGGSGDDRMTIGSASGTGTTCVVIYTDNTHADVALGGAAGGDAIAPADVYGFVWLPVVAGIPVGVPARNGNVTIRGRQATIIDAADKRFYYYDTISAGWHFAQFADFDPTYNSVTAQAATGLTLSGKNTSTWSTDAGGIFIRANNGGVLGVTSTQIIMSGVGPDITVNGNLTGVVGATLGTAALPWGSGALQSITVSLLGASVGTLDSDTLSSTKAATFTFNKSNGALGIATLTANDINFSVNAVTVFNLDNASSQLKFRAPSITAVGAVAVAITNAPAGVAGTPKEYLTILNPAGTTRYIPLLGA